MKNLKVLALGLASTLAMSGTAFAADHGTEEADMTGQLPSASGASIVSQPSCVLPLRPE